ncbi:T-complex protein 11-domain-containing protein [Triangularia verruculosa]|uniref:T-complex protein 11-domain-containing protein n=1 Tax=Triangularia verruculosa TaxID=2587418 RepID=A0AAN6XC72_9PEZI|nr:T-complex protein 11-domain-containing protein [Triangularia verruculosa]
MRRPSLDLTEPERNLEESIRSPTAGNPDPVHLSLPPPDEEIDLVEGDADAAKISTPPPHIAARLFYRPTNQTRRKDSAASSRRNSISSAHSRSSHGYSLEGGPQSKYVAQHLRRASILEDRKARLADRAAHAEKVRLRAALAKAATKDTSASEERALAAAQARERNLAEIAASCAEEVKRAKAVAESMKEKREQEARKMKTQMEEKLAEAERRRDEFRSRNSTKNRGRERGQSLGTRKSPPVESLPDADTDTSDAMELSEPAPMTEDVAVSKIQWWWRALQRQRSVAEFSALGLSIDAVRETSFDKVTVLLSQEKVLLVTSRILRICGLDEGTPGSVEEMAAVRTFLSAFLILGHPSQVLSNKEGQPVEEPEQDGSGLAKPIPKDELPNPQSQELVGKARDLLVSFENILGRLTSSNNFTPPPALFTAFSEVYATFHNAFIAWKARDSSSLVELMVMQFVELDAIWESVKDSTDGSVDQVYKKSIRDNQLLLLVRIKKLAGPARGKQMVADAVKAARRAKAKKPVGDMKPRVADHSITETAMGVLGVEEGTQQDASSQMPTPPSTPARKRDTFKVNVIIPSQKSLLPDNRIVVHELAINKEFRTEPHEYHEQQADLLNPIFEDMRATMHSQNQEAHFFLLLRVAESIREKLQRLVKPGNSMHSFIGELLDTEIAKQQFAMGSFSYEKFFEAMGSLLPKLCAPVRDEEVKKLTEEKLSQGSYVDRLEALNGFIDVMLSDYANYLLQLAAPQLVTQAPAYEAKAFAADLEARHYDLSVALRTWKATQQKVLVEASRRDPEGVNHPSSRPTANRIYAQMLVDLFTQPSPVALEDMPEMLRLDHKRAVEAGRLTRRIVITGAILLQCKNLLKRDVRAPWRNEAQRIFAVLERNEQQSDMTLDVAVEGIMAALEAGRSMPAATKGQLKGLVGKFLVAGAEAATLPRDVEVREPVLRLLLSRLRGHILARLAAVSTSDKVKFTSTAGEKLAGLGLAEFVDKVRDMVDMLGRVSVVDREAHGVWWDQVAEQAGTEVSAN